MLLFDRIPVRFRLSLAHSALMALIYLAIGFGLYAVLEKNLDDSVNSALLSSARFIRDSRYKLGEADPIDSLIDQFFRDSFDAVGVHYVRPYAQIMNISGKIYSKTDNIRADLPITPLAFHRAEKGLTSIETFSLPGQAPLRQVTLPVTLQGKFTGEIIQVGASMSHTQEALNNAALILWMILPSTLLVSIFFGYFLTARSLKPVKAITRAAASMGIDDLAIRLPEPHANDELRDLSQTFNKLLDRLEDALSRLKRFTADVSHELRTPLAVLRGEAELALRRPRDGETYQKALKSIALESVRMSEIIEDLLLLARAQSQSVAMSHQRIGLNSFVTSLLNEVETLYRQKNVTLLTFFASDLPTHFSASPNYLRIALKNILLNAAKHTPSGRSVRLRLFCDYDFLVFSVLDEGEGIDPESLPFIFDPFFRADTARNRAVGGVGIGLSLALALIKLHGGKITVESKLRKGARFDVLIPTSWA